MTAATPAPSFWQRRVAAPIVAQLTQGVTPEKIALTLALGLAGGLFPFLGFTTLLCFLLALAFRLNQPIIHAVNQLLWPAQLSLIAVYVKLGARIYGAQPLPFDPTEVTRVFWSSQREFWARFGLMGLHALTAWLLSAPLLVGVGYGVSLPLVRKLASAAHLRA